MSTQTTGQQREIAGTPPSLLENRRAPWGRKRRARNAQETAQHRRPAGSDENWKRDEHWAAVTAYLGQMYFPNEG